MPPEDALKLKGFGVAAVYTPKDFQLNDIMADNPTVDQWYNPADFVAPPANTYGDSGRGILYGPGHINFDTSLSKRFTVIGRANVEFRWDAFNLFNHSNWANPTVQIGSTSLTNGRAPAVGGSQ